MKLLNTNKKYLLALSLNLSFFIIVFCQVFPHRLFAQPQPLVITDIDDTLKQSYVRASGKERWKFYWYSAQSNRAFSQISYVIYALVCKPQINYNINCDSYSEDNEDFNSKLHYVTGSPGPLAHFGSEFLETLQFPRGAMHNRPLSNPSTKSFKLQTIERIVREFHPQTLILLGDNGQWDSAVYQQITQLPLTPPSTYVFIRKVYDAPVASEIMLGQVGFYSSVDLAFYLRAKGLISQKDFEMILIKTLEDDRSEHSQVIPEFMSCSNWRSDLAKFEPSPNDFENHGNYVSTWNALLQICK